MATKPKTPQPSTPTEVQERDLFETPRYATELILPFIPPITRYIWEPCAGVKRRMAQVLGIHLGEQWGDGDWDVHCTDICTRPEWDCLTYDPDDKGYHWDAAITNPPFSLKKKVWERFVKLDKCFALLIPADYSLWIIEAIKAGAEKVVPTRRIDYITPNLLERLNAGEHTNHTSLLGIPGSILARYSTSQFHSMFLCWKFGIGRTETFVELTREMKLNIL